MKHLGDLIAALRRWPLLLVGLAVLGWAVLLAPPGDQETVKALAVIGAVLLGAGIARVLRDDDDKSDNSHD